MAGGGKAHTTKSLADIFNAFVEDVDTRFTELKGRFVLWDMNTFDVYGAQYLDQKRTGLSEQTAYKYLSKQQVVEEMDEDEKLTSESVETRNAAFMSSTSITGCRRASSTAWRRRMK